MPPKQPNTDLHPAAHQKLKELQEALLHEGVTQGARLQDIASALILYTPPQQASGMLAAFSRQVARDREAE
jgi:hypothetical protein